MALPLPTSLSPSKVSTFKDCALAFRFSAIDKLPEPPSLPAVKGTTVHRALELLFAAEPADRTPELAQECLQEALLEQRSAEEYLGLGLDATAEAAFGADAATMVERYFTLEDPRTITPVGLELMLEADVGGVLVRGIIDRLEEDAQGDLVVTDYKTGRTPSVQQEQSRLGGVHFYAFLCQQVLGRIPARIQLVYLGGEPQIITTTPSEQSVRGMQKKIGAIWSAVERACELDDFRPKQSALCNWCAFRAYCPAFGGDPDQARAVGLALAAERAAALDADAEPVAVDLTTAPTSLDDTAVAPGTA
jgi:putative RecB family exonuclease